MDFRTMLLSFMHNNLTDYEPFFTKWTDEEMANTAISLGINDVWQVFGKLWNEMPETLRSHLNKALDQKKSLLFQEKLENTLR